MEAAEDGTSMQPVHLGAAGEQVVCCRRESLATIWRVVHSADWPSPNYGRWRAMAALTTRRRPVDVFIITTGTIPRRPPEAAQRIVERRNLPLKWQRSYLLPVALISVRSGRLKDTQQKEEDEEEEGEGGGGQLREEERWTGLAAFISLAEWPHCWLLGLAAGGVGNC